MRTKQPPSNLGWHVNCSPIASFPGHSPSSFWLLPVCKNGRGRPGPFYQVNDISVYLGRQRVSAQRSAFCACVLRFESGAVCFRFLNAWNFSSWDRNYKIRLHDLSFDWGPLPPLSTWVGLPPSFLHTASDQKLDGERPGNEAIRLQFTCHPKFIIGWRLFCSNSIIIVTNELNHLNIGWLYFVRILFMAVVGRNQGLFRCLFDHVTMFEAL